MSVEFGFGAFLEKVEVHFGTRVLKVLLILIGLAVALFCGKTIWDIALGPLVSFALSTTAGGQWIQALIKVFWSAIAFAGGIALASLIGANLLAWRDYKRGQELLRKTHELRDEVASALVEAASVLGKAKAIVKEAKASAKPRGKS